MCVCVCVRERERERERFSLQFFIMFTNVAESKVIKGQASHNLYSRYRYTQAYDLHFEHSVL